MPYGYGCGFGFRGASPPRPYIGRGRGGLPRCWYPGGFTAGPDTPGLASYPYYGGAWAPPFYRGYPAPEATPYAPEMSREQELDFLTQEADVVKGRLEEIEARIKELEVKES